MGMRLWVSSIMTFDVHALDFTGNDKFEKIY